MKNLKVLNNQEEFDSLYPDGNVPSKDIAYVKETKEVVFSTNNVDGTFELVRATQGGGFDPSDLSIYLTKEEYELDSSAFITSQDASVFLTSNDVSVYLTNNDVSKYASLDGKNFGNLMVGDNSSTHSYYIGTRKSYNGEESISQFLNDGLKTNISNRVGSTVNSRIILDKDGATIQYSGDNHTAYNSGDLQRIATQEWVSNDVSIYVTESQLSNEVSTFITDNDVSLLITEDDLNYETWIFTLSDDSSISKNVVIK